MTENLTTWRQHCATWAIGGQAEPVGKSKETLKHYSEMPPRVRVSSTGSHDSTISRLPYCYLTDYFRHRHTVSRHKSYSASCARSDRPGHRFMYPSEACPAEPFVLARHFLCRPSTHLTRLSPSTCHLPPATCHLPPHAFALPALLIFTLALLLTLPLFFFIFSGVTPPFTVSHFPVFLIRPLLARR
jgi:hypothetical protein